MPQANATPANPTPAPGELIDAILANDVKAVEDLLKRGASIKEEDKIEGYTLGLAVERGYTDIARLLFDYGAELSKNPPGGVTELMAAALDGHTEMVRLLIGRGAEVNATDEKGMTALMETDWKLYAC